MRIEMDQRLLERAGLPSPELLRLMAAWFVEQSEFDIASM